MARNGRGVIETLREISSLTLMRIKEALEHAAPTPKNVAVHFDVNHGQQMVKMEDLPVKKVSVEQMAASEAGQEVITQAPVIVPAASEKAAGPPVAEPRRPAVENRALGDLLGRLEDPSRITRIEKISGGNGRLNVEIKDGDGRALRSLQIALQPETKKVTIILDVKS